MNNKNNSIEPENKNQVTQSEDMNQYNDSGVYLRDDHCDWGSSGIEEISGENSGQTKNS